MLRRAALLTALAVLVAPGAAQADALTIQVTSVVLEVDGVDKKPKGPSAGDRVFQRNKLLNAVRQFNKPKGTRVGTDEGTIVFTGPHTERYQGVARFPNGTIRVKGVVKLTSDGGIRIPIVGGTGRYKSAKGTLYVGPGERRALNVYEFTLPGHIA